MGDSEIDAMAAVAGALAELEQDAQVRVIRWAADRYGVTLGAGANDLPGQGGGRADGTATLEGTPNPDDAAVISAVAAETNVPAEKLEKLFHVDGVTVKLLGPSTAYGASATAQARAVAQVVTVVRKLGMGSADTPFDVIKDACVSKHCYDSTNFATYHLSKIDGYVVKGEGKSRRLEVKTAGLTAFPALVDKILGES